MGELKSIRGLLRCRNIKCKCTTFNIIEYIESRKDVTNPYRGYLVLCADCGERLMDWTTQEMVV